MGNHQIEYFNGYDGSRRYEQVWLPTGDVRAVVSILHGWAEYSDRYLHVVAHLLQQQYAVTAMDMYGHGRSDGQRGLLPTFAQGAADLATFVQRTRDRFADVPYFHFAHSMGGAYTIEYVCTHEVPFRGMLLSGPGIKIHYKVNALLMAANNLAFRLLPRLPTLQLEKGLSTSDPEMQADADADPLIFRRRVPVQTAYLTLNAWSHFEPMLPRVTVPFVVFHGTEDALAAVDSSQALYRAATATDKTLNLLDGFKHEVVNEVHRADVLRAMVEWIEARRA